jgi:hypothetical protein
MTSELREELCQALAEASLLLRFAMMNTTSELAEDGMEYVRKYDALVKKARES